MVAPFIDIRDEVSQNPNPGVVESTSPTEFLMFKIGDLYLVLPPARDLVVATRAARNRHSLPCRQGIPIADQFE